MAFEWVDKNYGFCCRWSAHRYTFTQQFQYLVNINKKKIGREKKNCIGISLYCSMLTYLDPKKGLK